MSGWNRCAILVRARQMYRQAVLWLVVLSNVCRDMGRRCAKRLEVYQQWKRVWTSRNCDKCDCESGRQVAERKIQTAVTSLVIVGSRRSLYHHDRDDDGHSPERSKREYKWLAITSARWRHRNIQSSVNSLFIVRSIWYLYRIDRDDERYCPEM